MLDQLLNMAKNLSGGLITNGLHNCSGAMDMMRLKDENVKVKFENEEYYSLRVPFVIKLNQEQLSFIHGENTLHKISLTVKQQESLFLFMQNLKNHLSNNNSKDDSSQAVIATLLQGINIEKGKQAYLAVKAEQITKENKTFGIGEIIFVLDHATYLDVDSKIAMFEKFIKKLDP